MPLSKWALQLAAGFLPAATLTHTVKDPDGLQTMAQRPSTAVRHRFWSSLRILLQSWWLADRIRISPCTGRILALHPGDRFLLMHQIWTVTGRDIRCRESSTSLRLKIHCETEQQTAELICPATEVVSTRSEPAGLRINGQTIPVWDEDLSLLPSNTVVETAAVRNE